MKMIELKRANKLADEIHQAEDTVRMLKEDVKLYFEHKGMTYQVHNSEALKVVLKECEHELSLLKIKFEKL